MMNSRHLPTSNVYYEQVERQQQYSPVQDPYGRELYIDYGGLTIDTRGRIVGIRNAEPQLFNPRLSPPRSYQRNLEQTSTRSDHRSRDTRLQSTMAGQKSSISFDKGLKKLEKALLKSEEFFSQFIQDFDSDMRATEKYHSLEIQKDLWRQKIIGARDKRTIRDDQNGQEGEDDGEEPSKKFEEQKKELSDAFQLALDAKYKEKKGSTSKGRNASAAKRLQDKIRVANDHITSLLEEATEDRENCDDLVIQISELKATLDTEKAKYKDLFKEDSNQEASKDGGEAVDPSGGNWQ